MTWPWYKLASAPERPTGTITALRSQVQAVQTDELDRLRLVNEFLRAEVETAKRSQARLLSRSAGA